MKTMITMNDTTEKELKRFTNISFLTLIIEIFLLLLCKLFYNYVIIQLVPLVMLYILILYFLNFYKIYKKKRRES